MTSRRKVAGQRSLDFSKKNPIISSRDFLMFFIAYFNLPKSNSSVKLKNLIRYQVRTQAYNRKYLNELFLANFVIRRDQYAMTISQ